MQKEAGDMFDKKVAAVCGLYCEACSWFIATNENPERLIRLAGRFNWSEEGSRCHGCRSGTRLPYCQQCKMAACAAEQGMDFCSECAGYPCDELKTFQAALPHRIELYDNLERIRSVGYEQWLREIRAHYTCPSCRTINSAYDLQCRECGTEPSCRYVAEHRQEIEQHLKKR
jgi:hypothetical protein